MSFIPVAPGWLIIPEKPAYQNEWYHLVGWTDHQTPVIAWQTGTVIWDDAFGTDRFVVCPADELLGGRAYRK